MTWQSLESMGGLLEGEIAASAAPPRNDSRGEAPRNDSRGEAPRNDSRKERAPRNDYLREKALILRLFSYLLFSSARLSRVRWRFC